MKYAVLGGGGSFGINTSLYLLDRGIEVLGIGRNPLPGREYSLGIEACPGYQYWQGHLINDFNDLLGVLQNQQPEVIINYAAQGEGALSWKESWRYFETNAVALSRLVEALQGEKWLRRFIQIGTSEMYGSVDEAVDEDAPIRPTSPYAASKVAFDLYLQSIKAAVPWNIVRPSNCYGPGQRLHRIIPKTLVFGMTGRKVPLHGGGVAKKSFLHIRDLARAIYILADPENESLVHRIYNVGPESPTSIREVVTACARALRLRFEDVAEMADERHGQDSRYWLNSEKAHNELGWEQEIDWKQGLDEMVSWARRNLPQLKDGPFEYTVTP